MCVRAMFDKRGIVRRCIATGIIFLGRNLKYFSFPYRERISDVGISIRNAGNQSVIYFAVVKFSEE